MSSLEIVPLLFSVFVASVSHDWIKQAYVCGDLTHARGANGSRGHCMKNAYSNRVLRTVAVARRHGRRSYTPRLRGATTSSMMLLATRCVHRVEDNYDSDRYCLPRCTDSCATEHRPSARWLEIPRPLWAKLRGRSSSWGYCIRSSLASVREGGFRSLCGLPCA